MAQKIIHGECLEEMRKLEAGSVDLILTDPPYGTIKGLGGDIEKYKNLSNSNWDVTLDNKEIFKECERVLRENGKLILFSQEPYTSKLIVEAHNNLPFNYRLIWLKDHFANCLVVNKAPVSYFEDMVVFSKKYDTLNLNPLRNYARKLFKWIGKTKKQIFKDMNNQTICHFTRLESTQFKICTEKTYNDLIKLYGIDNWEEFIDYKDLKKLDCESTFNLYNGDKLKSNVLQYKKDYGGLHPTQKPVELLKDLIKTYSNEGDTVLDFTAGSFSTLVACQETNRKGIGIELEEKYVEIGRKRLQQTSISSQSNDAEKTVKEKKQ